MSNDRPPGTITIGLGPAWSMVGGLVAAGLYLGISIGTISTKIDGLGDVVIEQADRVADLQARMRSLEARILAMENRDERLQRDLILLREKIDEFREERDASP